MSRDINYQLGVVLISLRFGCSTTIPLFPHLPSSQTSAVCATPTVSKNRQTAVYDLRSHGEMVGGASRFQQIVEPCGAGSLFEGHMQLSPRPCTNCAIVGVLVSMTDSVITFPALFTTVIAASAGKYVGVEGGKIYYEECGTGDETVLLIHKRPSIAVGAPK
jgi:hypothetical protein